ncbi:hypothetical protein DPX16_8951 [Anabarilius grahami]|uniref:Uncharacterized protein n=1 Tax=Anabarilius grahami TaxID=495550 RepID=A0A3N0ZA58_ANAGA|nr:hypothetical protein DPX16_8951 [Anabarilius grahami]
MNAISTIRYCQIDEEHIGNPANNESRSNGEQGLRRARTAREPQITPKKMLTVRIHRRGTEQPLFNSFSVEAERKARTGNCGIDREAKLVVKASKS